jgi:hypothetical protein
LKSSPDVDWVGIFCGSWTRIRQKCTMKMNFYVETKFAPHHFHRKCEKNRCFGASTQFFENLFKISIAIFAGIWYNRCILDFTCWNACCVSSGSTFFRAVKQ